MPTYEYKCVDCGHRLLGEVAAAIFKKAWPPLHRYAYGKGN